MSSFRVRRILQIGGGVGIAAAATVAMKYDQEDIKYEIKKAFGLIDKKDKKVKIVVLGSGWAALSLIQHLDKDRVDLKIVSPRSFFFYTPLLAGTSTGTVSHASIMEPIRWYCDDSEQTSYVQGECLDVDLDKKVITVSYDPSGQSVPIPYDHLVVAVGAEPATFGIPGVHEHAIFMKEIEDSISVQRKVLQNLEKASSLLACGANDAEIDQLLHWVVIGGGPTGVELTAELSDFIRQDVKKYFPSIAHRVKLTLVEATDRLLGMFDRPMSSYAQSTLEDGGASVLTNAMVTTITADHVELKLRNATTGVQSPHNLNHGLVVWAGGIATRPITKKVAARVGAANQSSRWGLEVDKKFRVKGAKDVWAIGDCAVAGCGPTAQAANQQGIYLGRLFRDTQFDQEKISMSPEFQYHNKGALAYVGGSKGVAELKSLLWDHYPTPGGQVSIEGAGAFAIWRSLYFSKLMSGRNQAQVGFDWIRTSLFGRDISSPYITKPTVVGPAPIVATSTASEKKP